MPFIFWTCCLQQYSLCTIIFTTLGVFSTVKKVIRFEGPVGLYRGNGAQMIRIFPYAAVQFTAYEHYKVVRSFPKLITFIWNSHTSQLAPISICCKT